MAVFVTILKSLQMKQNDKKPEDENIPKSMKLLMQEITRQRLHIIRSLESDLDNIDTNHEINVSLLPILIILNFVLYSLGKWKVLKLNTNFLNF